MSLEIPYLVVSAKTDPGGQRTILLHLFAKSALNAE